MRFVLAVVVEIPPANDAGLAFANAVGNLQMPQVFGHLAIGFCPYYLVNDRRGDAEIRSQL